MRDKKFIENYKNIGIIGIARSGISVARLLKRYGINIFLSDYSDKSKFSDIDLSVFDDAIEFGGHSEKLFDMDAIVVSPGVPLSSSIFKKIKEKNIPIFGEIDIAYKFTHPDTKIIAVTGSNGKSTTVSLIYHILKEKGFDVILAGNIGDAYSGFDVETQRDFIVLELSSFQLELVGSLRADVAAILNITPDHLNRYASLWHYAMAKFNIFNNSTENDLNILGYDSDIVLENITSKGGESVIAEHALQKHHIHNYSFFSTKSTDEKKIDAFIKDNDIYIKGKKVMENIHLLPLKGPHTYQNILASLLAVSSYIDFTDIFSIISSFKPLEHRMEHFLEFNGVEFVNDSKATNTESVKNALKSYDKPIHLILGGSDKGEDFKDLFDDFDGEIKKLYLIGETAEKMSKDFMGKYPLEIFNDFESAIKDTIKNSERGDIVLLSPACASFDWFQNYEDRGKKFKALVRKLTIDNWQWTIGFAE